MAQVKFVNVTVERDEWQQYAEDTCDQSKQEAALLAVDVLDQVVEELQAQRQQEVTS